MFIKPPLRPQNPSAVVSVLAQALILSNGDSTRAQGAGAAVADAYSSGTSSGIGAAYAQALTQAVDSSGCDGVANVLAGKSAVLLLLSPFDLPVLSHCVMFDWCSTRKRRLSYCA